MIEINENDDIENKSQSMFKLGRYYQNEKDYDNMKIYYYMAIEYGVGKAMYNLGLHYQYTDINYDNMKKYYLMVIESSNGEYSSSAMNNIAYHYETIKDYENMKKYYEMAILHKNEVTLKNIERIRKAIANIPNDIVVLNDNIDYLNDLAKRMTCCICITNEQNTVFNCGHSTCSDCSLKIDMCGLCKKKITIKIKQYR
jgi:tetratricopeptide (TPR) repeat protein